MSAFSNGPNMTGTVPIVGEDVRLKNFVGPPAWELLHSAARLYRPSTVTNISTISSKRTLIQRLLKCYTELFCCERCQVHLRQKLRENPIDAYLTSQENVFYYVYWLHDMVNSDINNHAGHTVKLSPSYQAIKVKYASIGDDTDPNVVSPAYQFGKSGWTVLHSFAVTYRREKLEAMIEFLHVLGELFQSKAFQEYLEIYPPETYLENNQDAFLYTYLLHELINHQINNEHGRIIKVSPSYHSLKNEYFLNLGGGQCKACSV